MREDRMARTAYCKKCGKEVEPGEICPLCGTRLGKNSAHAAWCVERTPVRDWMYWNSVMRVLLPGGLAILLATAAAVVFAVLLMQGKELSDFVVDSRGIHETRYLPDPTPLKMLTRMKAPRIPEEGVKVIKIGERHLAWKDVERVQLWPEKCMVLFYAPGWWLRIPVACTPFSWEDVMDYIREKLGKKKKVRIPDFLREESGVRPARQREVYSAPAPEVMGEQISMEEMSEPAENPAEDTPEMEQLP